MAGVITHMVIAREILKFLPEGTIRDQGLFCLGNLAPDAIHAREGFVRAQKKHTHFRDDIMDRDFEQEDNLALFHNRLSNFIIENRERKDGLLDLYRGYVAHIITDELFMLTIRKEFTATMEEQGIAQSDRPYFDYIISDMNRNDLLLVNHYEGSEEIRNWMEQVPIYPIKDYLSEQEMSASRDWLIYRHFTQKQELLAPIYISYDRMLDFIQLAAGCIVQRLSEGGSLPRMF
jgi:hypothetical protein